MFSIFSSNSKPHQLKQLHEWFVLEWGQIDPFEDTKNGFIVPSPLLAVDGQKLLGGLAFTRYPVPGSEEIGLWVNGLFVAPEHRGIGIGSQLIQAAEVESAGIKAIELFVNTNVPELYQKLGWLNVDGNGECKVLKKVVANK